MADKETNDAAAVAQKITELDPYQDVAARLHDVIMEAAPELKPRLWYGMPGYAKARSSPVVCFFRVDDGFMTFGITEKANLTPPNPGDHMVESAWFLTGLDQASEDRIRTIVTRAIS